MKHTFSDVHVMALRSSHSEELVSKSACCKYSSVPADPGGNVSKRRSSQGHHIIIFNEEFAFRHFWKHIDLNARLPLDLSRYIRRPVPKTFHSIEKRNI